MTEKAPTWGDVRDTFHKTNLRYYSPELAEKYAAEDADKWMKGEPDGIRDSLQNHESPSMDSKRNRLGSVEHDIS